MRGDSEHRQESRFPLAWKDRKLDDPRVFVTIDFQNLSDYTGVQLEWFHETASVN